MIGLVQHTTNYDTGSATQNLPLAFSSNVLAGNFIAVVVTSFTSTVSSVTDSLGNTYTQAVTTSVGGNKFVYIYYAYNSKGGANTVTVNFSAANNTRSFGIYEYCGVAATSDPKDQTNSSTGVGTSAPSPGAIVPKADHELIIGAGVDFGSGVTGTVTGASGYTVEDQQDDNLTHERYYMQDRVLMIAGSTTASFTTSGNVTWAAVVASFYAAPFASVPLVIKPRVPRINWSNPLTKGLVFDCPYIEGGGTSPIDIVTGNKGQLIANTWQKGNYGYEVKGVAGGTTRVTFNLLPSQSNLTQISVEQLLFIPSGLIHFYAPWYLGQEVAGGNAGGRHYIEVNGATGTTMAFVVNTQGTFVAGASWITIPAPAGYFHMLTTMDDSLVSNLPVWYINGLPQAIAGSTISTGTIQSDNATFTIGNTDLASGDPEGWPSQIVYTRMYNRIVQPEEAKELASDPFRIYMRRRSGFAQGSFKPILKVQSASNTSVTTSVTATLGATPTTNNLLIAAVEANVTNANISMTGSGWLQATTTPASGNSVTIFYKVCDGTDTTAIKANGTGASVMQIQAFEYSGISITSPLDQTAIGVDGGSGVTSRTSGTTATTLYGSELLFVAYGMANPNGGSLSFTNQFTSQITSTNRLATAAKVVSITGTYESTASWTSSVRAGGLIATFIGANV